MDFSSLRRREENKPNLVSGGTIKASLGFLVRLYAVRYADMSVLLLLNSTTINVKFMKCKGQIYTSWKKWRSWKKALLRVVISKTLDVDIILNSTGSVPASIFSPLGSPYGITVNILQQKGSTYRYRRLVLLSKTPWGRSINWLLVKFLTTNNHNLVLY